MRPLFHVNQLCKKASKNPHVSARIAKYMDIDRQGIFMKAFVSWQFCYCPLIWMFHSRKMEHRINSIYKRTLKLVYEDSHGLTFQEFLAEDKSATVHQKGPSVIGTEIFKSKTRVSSELMNNICHFVERLFKLRSKHRLERTRDHTHTVYHDSESLSSLAPQLLDLLANSPKAMLLSRISK